MNITTLGGLVTILATALALGLLLQIVDVVSGHLVRRAGRAAGSRDRDRILAWTVTLCSIAAVLLIIGVNVAVRLVVETMMPLLGLLMLVGLVAATAAVSLWAARALRRPQTGYQVLRDELKGVSTVRLSRGRLADYRRWVETLDARQNDLSRRVAVGRIVRSIPPILAAVVIATVIWLATVGAVASWVAVFPVLALVGTVWLSISGARISLARNLALNAVHGKLRAEVLLMLEDLDRKAPRKVSGLTERVSRALAILREQQGQQTPPE